MLLPDYSACGSNIIASILASFGLPTGHAGLAFLDAELARAQYRNIILMVLDGLSLDSMTRLLPKDGFLLNAPRSLYSSVFPSTTTAATTTLLSGMNPGRHGWLGWTIFVQELGLSIDTFPNNIQFSRAQAADYHVAGRLMPYQPVTEIITASGLAQGHHISPYGNIKADSLEAISAACLTALKEPGRHYIYAYWPEPDHHMHTLGCDHERLRPIVAGIDGQIARLAAALSEDTLLLVTADHGLVDAQPLYLEDHPRLEAMLLRPPTVEARAAALHVRKSDLHHFAAAFLDAFADQFWLMPSEEALAKGLFGPPPHHPLTRGMLGDYLAIATKKHALYQKRAQCQLIGMHGGLSEQEMRLALILAKSGH